MGKDSNIEWTDHTVNLWWGCAKVHKGCKNCYAEAFSDHRYGNELWGENQPRKLIKSSFKNLQDYQKAAKLSGRKQIVFVGSMMDIFEDSKKLQNPVGDYRETKDLRQELFVRISDEKYDNLIFLFLTKRPENILEMIPWNWGMGEMPKNVWFGCSVSDTDSTEKFIPIMNQISMITPNLFISMEPQIEPIELIDLTNIKWLIQGGESGWNSRQFHTEWARRMREICKEQDTAYFFNQINKRKPIPEDLMIREFPKFYP